MDRVIENYRSLRQSNRRMSAADKQRLDDHMDRLAELQRRVNVKPKPLASCKDLAPPGSGGDYLTDMQALLDVIAAGFICGTSRIGVLSINESEFVADNGDWHQSVAHQWQLEGPQAKLQEANQQAFQHALLYLAAQLEVEESPDRVVYENVTMHSADWSRLLVSDLNLEIRRGSRWLVIGKDDAPKVALFRATAGVWGCGAGRIIRPSLDDILFLPERPYLPPGTLREALLRTGMELVTPDSEIMDVVTKLGLEDVVSHANGLDVDQDWDDLLSIGEQHLISIMKTN